jgi:hypothetical protein
MDNLHDEADLERALWFLYQQWRLLGYQHTEFYRLFSPDCAQYKGGIAAVQFELRQSRAASLEFLHRRGKLAFSIERLVLRETWIHLFGDEDKDIARERLARLSK